ncbi:6631_t:CDS:2 [Ambispora gerdemannii]|uniref:6631_t:CDS:1 n=1 Tax=Ambispora gerdemannii TaxID=144530 RepID=A0A9N9BRK1_9GLOM|nr:6631_t:CDS:2 [Ambispora gerdemannii]
MHNTVGKSTTIDGVNTNTTKKNNKTINPIIARVNVDHSLSGDVPSTPNTFQLQLLAEEEIEHKKRPINISSPIIRSLLLISAYFFWVILVLLGLGFSLYIIKKFLSHPYHKWKSIENFGATGYGAFFIGLHWVGGILVNVLITLQFLPVIRQRAAKFHIYSGRLIILGSICASIGGLFYVFTRGTVGGIQMSVSFSIYGFLFLFSALLTFYYARKRDFDRHKRWAVRTLALAIGSGLYRIYVIPLFSSALAAENSAHLNIAEVKKATSDKNNRNACNNDTNIDIDNDINTDNDNDKGL